ncbi:procathepsin L-like isoform X1 [Silurus meridionalis]|uniref:Cathepsin L.1 n=1 Tax=Silurus meridionalis TaxID=175797 RepID=A0A8T0BC95_SILME|nr:procathepsin L-like isoform X1 [Silurus meridionalis]KAF7704691.1 hypothetical protein HF521_021763 [Silurus meridionalis]
MKVLLVVSALVTLACQTNVSPEDVEFEAWKNKFGKIYSSLEEESQRKMAWLENRKLVLAHNLLADQGIESYRLGMTSIADLVNQEYRTMFMGCQASLNSVMKHNADTFVQQSERADLPTTVDWREKGYVTDIKDQFSCGSCWAFSTTGALEGQTFRKTGKLVSLSEQQLVDCSGKYGNNGCQGGFMEKAFLYVQENGGLDTEDSYPYENQDGVCRFNPATVGAKCTGYKSISPSEGALQEAVATIGPISVTIFVGLDSFKLYSSGVYDDPACNNSQLNHAVLVVGYGTGNGTDYWLVKNSWGLGWGDKGYMKISRNKGNLCGIASQTSYPLVDNESQVVRCETCSTIFVLGCMLLNILY